MRLPSSLIVSLLWPAALLGSGPGYAILGPDAGPWPKILSSVGLLPSSADVSVTVARPGTAAGAEWAHRLEEGEFLVLEGDSPLGVSFGFRAGGPAHVGSMVDTHAPKLPLILEKPLEVARYRLPAEARVFTKDRWSDTPMVAGFKRGKGGVLWLAASPGEQGYERFPYLAQALVDLGFEAPFRARRAWAFFDYSYRTRVDLDYFAAKWRSAGISALHVAAWHFYEPDAERDAYLLRLVQACHREGIQVYAWVELPHVSEKFWNDHPAWREKTAVLQDAALDWRKLMNLNNRECFEAVSQGVQSLIGRFDWDGVNLAELYFESLEGAANPARFTPLNDDVRGEFKREHGFDPVLLWSSRKDAASLRTFLDYRASLARRMQEEWLGEMEKCRRSRPDLDIVLTHVDDRMDRGMTDAIGADSARVFPLLDKLKFTFLVEDPATVWNLGPQRYPEIAKRYPASPKLAIDINVVERYQDVYPTKRQTGLELLQLLHFASVSFPRVALYFENSLSGPDLPLLPAASAVVTRYERRGAAVTVDSPHGFLLPWSGAGKVDGEPWAADDGKFLIIPAGTHTVEPGLAHVGPRLVSFNGELQSVRPSGNNGLDLTYESNARAFAEFDCEVGRLTVDGAVREAATVGRTVMLPSGARRASILCK